jgi:hypothetical protein
MTGVQKRRGRLAVGLGAVVCAILLASAPPAFGHVSFSSSGTFGFAPNTSGGLGTDGAAPPYIPGSTQTLYLRAPNEVTAPFSPTVDVKVTVPAGFTAPICGQAKKNVNDASTLFSNQPGDPAAGWSCVVETVNTHKVVHFSGPDASEADAASWYSFSVTVPSPATQTTYGRDPGTEGFLADQTYASGEFVHWIPSGTDDPDNHIKVATGLLRTVGGPGTAFHPVAPTRILDSRQGTGWSGKLSAGSPRPLTVTGGAAAVPAGVDAVVMNVTATESTANSFLTVYPFGSPPPTASNVNMAAYETIPNLVTVKVGTDGKVAFNTNSGETDVIGDLVGYYDDLATDRFNPLPPSRILDSRTATGGFTGPVTEGKPQSLHVHGGGVQESATAVVMNVTVTDSSKNSFLTVYPTGQAAPSASNLNFAAGQTIANLVVVKVGDEGQVDFKTAVGSVEVIADVVGYYDATQGDLFHPLAPGRILDSRVKNGLANSAWDFKPLVAGTDRALQVQGYGGVRFDATSVVANATVTGGTQNSYLTAYPAGQSLPGVSNLNFAVGQTIPNLTSVKLGTGGQIAFNNHLGSTNVIYDVVGFFAPPPPA